jgi:HEAT repeat protein
LMDEDARVSRAAALALVEARPRTPFVMFEAALRSTHAGARANAAWALGVMHAPTSRLVPMLKDKDPTVLQEVLVALSHMRGGVPRNALEAMFSNTNEAVHGAAAAAMAKHWPVAAVTFLPIQLNREINAERAIYAGHGRTGGGKFTQPDIDRIVASYRCQMEMLGALHMLDGYAATYALETQAFGPTEDYLQPNAMVAAFNLWDRVATEPGPVMQALGSRQIAQSDRAQWVLIHAGASVLPQVRMDLRSDDSAARRRAIQIVAWQGDADSLKILLAMQAGPDADVVTWAIEKIESLQPNYAVTAGSR